MASYRRNRSYLVEVPDCRGLWDLPGPRRTEEFARKTDAVARARALRRAGVPSRLILLAPDITSDLAFARTECVLKYFHVRPKRT